MAPAAPRHTYTDRAHGITTSLSWKGSGLLRPYGACLADDKVSVRIELGEIPAVNPHPDPPARARSTAPLAWVASGEQSYACAGEADSRILVRDGGVVQWQVAGRVVASSIGGGGRRSHVATQPCLWPALSEFPRYDLQYGEGLAPHGGIPFLPEADPSAHPALGSWTLEASEDLSLLVPQLRAPAGEGEAVVNLRLPIDPQGIAMADSDGDLVVHHHDGMEWSAWTSVARIPLGAKRYLRIEPLEAARPVILVRARLKSWVLSLYSQRSASATSLSHWSLALEESAAEFSGAEAQDHSGDQTGGSA